MRKMINGALMALMMAPILALAAPANVLYTTIKGNQVINLTDGDCYDTKGGYHPGLMALFAVHLKSNRITMGCWQLDPANGQFVVVLNSGVIYRFYGNELTGM